MDILAVLKAERDKAAQQVKALDTATRALSELNSTRVSHGPRKMSAAARARISASQKSTMGTNTGPEGRFNCSQASHLSSRSGTNQSGGAGKTGKGETAEENGLTSSPWRSIVQNEGDGQADHYQYTTSVRFTGRAIQAEENFCLRGSLQLVESILPQLPSIMPRKFILILPALAMLGALFLFAFPDDLQDEDAALQTKSDVMDVMREPSRGIPARRMEKGWALFLASIKSFHSQKSSVETILSSPTLESLSACVLRC